MTAVKKEQAEVPGFSSFEEEVWSTLSRTDVSDHIKWLEASEKRPAIDYLPWHAAWYLAKRKFPASTFRYLPDTVYADGTVEVEVEVTIRRGEDSITMSVRLPVMNMHFSPITKPTSRQLNDSRQRCLVKALAFHGLGLNLWSESSVPVGRLEDPISPEQYAMLTDLIKSTDTDEDKFLDWCDVKELKDLPYERYHSAVALLEAKARRQQKAKNLRPKTKAEESEG